jgi:predicted ATP-grasp superfamily ATP-dependent carboligase
MIPEYFQYENDYCQLPAVIIGSHKIGLGIIRALGIKNVPVVSAYYNKNDMGYVSKYVIDKYFIANPIENETEFIKQLIEIGKKYKNSVLFASDDPTLLSVAKHRSILSEYYIVESNDINLIEKIIVKKNTYDIADKIGILYPKTYNPISFEEAVEYYRLMDSECILKPSIGHLFFNIFKKKMLIIRSIEELKTAFDMIEGLDIKMMMQEFIPGDDKHGVNYNLFSINGEPIVEFTAQKIRLSPPNIGFPRVIVSKWIREVIEPGRKIINYLNYNGFACLEFKKHALNGNFYLMELNGRQNLSTPLAVRCGYNFPYLTYRYLIDKSLPKITSNFEQGIYWIDTGKDIIETIKSRKIENLPFKEFIRPYFMKNTQTIFDKNDLMPLLKRFLDGIIIIVKKLLNLTKRRLNEG